MLLFAGAAAASAVATAGAARADRAPRIVIVGAGIAGLTAARTFLRAGLPFTIYEASQRVGGRMHSDTRTWRNGQVSEHCGELIDTDHTTIISLARHYKIGLTDVLAAEPNGSTDTYFFFGHYYPVAQANQDFAPVYEALTRDQNAAGYPTTFDQYNAAGELLDNTSIYDWIEKNVPGGHRSRMGRLLDVAYDIEFGGPTSVQSALNIVYLLGSQTDPQNFSIFGSSDEHYHITGGNERLPQAIAGELEWQAPGALHLGTSLTSIAKRDDGRYSLGLLSADRRFSVDADHVILAIPFSVLRNLDYAQAGFDQRKKMAIAELGYGTNVKLQLQFNSRLWNAPGPWGRSTGEVFTDLRFQNTWEVTRGQHGNTGILVNYLGSAGADVQGSPSDPAAARFYANSFLNQLELVYPGISRIWNGLATLDVPARSPFLKGSYSYWKLGQYTTIAGTEGLPSGRCHFAGEHCSIDFQGYMEGGAREGIRAAQEVVKALASG
jgi:monoamine oxidase